MTRCLRTSFSLLLFGLLLAGVLPAPTASAQAVSGNVDVKLKYTDPYTSTTHYLTNQNATVQVPLGQSLTIYAGYDVTEWSGHYFRGVDTFVDYSMVADKCGYGRRGMECGNNTQYDAYTYSSGTHAFGADLWIYNRIYQSFIVSSRLHTIEIIKFEASISGPALLDEAQTGTWTATVSNIPPGGTPSYQWFYRPDGASSWTTISGATSTTLTYSFAAGDYAIKFEASASGETALDTYNIIVQEETCGGFECKQATTPEAADEALLTHAAPATFSLDGNYPNPFNPSTEIRFGLAEAAPVSLVVYDVMGRAVAELVRGTLEAGSHSVTWNASGLPSGIYLYRLQAGAHGATGRMSLLK